MRLKWILPAAIMACLLSMSQTVQGAMYSGTSFPNSGYIPDATSTGPSAWANTVNVTESGLPSNVSVTLSLSGGYNGDLYAYLSHDGQALVLLNRVGTGVSGQTVYGFSTSGFSNVRLDDYGSSSIHDVATPTTYTPGTTYKPDSGGGATFANTFGGSSVNGTWTLFFSDMSQGSVSQVTGWSLSFDLAEVPEPTNVALAGFGVLAAGLGAWRRWRGTAK